MDPKLIDETMTALKSLSEEKTAAQDTLNHFKSAVKLAFVLADKGLLSVDNIQSKIDELSEKKANDLEVIEKAASMTVDGLGLALGLSDGNKSYSNHDPLTAFLLEDQ